MKTLYEISLFFLFVLTLPVFIQAQKTDETACKSSLKNLPATEKQAVIDEIRLYFRGAVTEPDALYKMSDTWLYFDGCRDYASEVSLKREMPLEARDLRRKKIRQNISESLGVSGNNSESKTLSALIALLVRDEDAKSLANEAIAMDSQNYEAYFAAALTGFPDSPDEALQNIDKAIALNPKFAPAYALKAEILLNQTDKLAGDALTAKYEETFKTLDAYLPLTSSFAASVFWRSQREALDSLLKSRRKQAENIKLPKPDAAPVLIPIKILTRPQPRYTLAAKNTFTEGNVVLNVWFDENGKTKRVLIVQSLPFGLTREAVNAANEINFEPATRDGKPVSVIKRVFYTFTIY